MPCVLFNGKRIANKMTSERNQEQTARRVSDVKFDINHKDSMRNICYGCFTIA